jgi:polar amino acid transport system substrate-binding protein
MKLRMIYLMLLFLLICLVQTVQAETINIGYFNLAPHTYHGSNGPEGAAITYFKMLASKMGDTIEWTGPLPLPRLTQLLKEGKLDATLGFPQFPVFEEFLYYTENYLYMGQPTFAVSKNKKITAIKTIDDIKGYSIGAVKSSSGLYTAIIDENRDKISLQELAGEDWMVQNLKKLVAAHLDAIYDRQEFTLPYVAKTLGILNEIKLIAAPANPIPLFIVISKQSTKGKALLERCNTYMPQINYNYNAAVQDEMNKIKK